MPRKDKKRQIMRAAEKLFTRRRFHEITLEDVAKLARVGKGTIYLYFQDKDDLFFQTALAGFDDLCDLLQQKVPKDAPFEDQLHTACKEVSWFFQRRQQAYRLIQAEDARLLWSKGYVKETWKEKRQRVVAVLAAIMRNGVEGGRVRTDIPAEAMASVLMGMLRMQAMYLVEHPEAQEHIELLVDLFYRGAGWADACRCGPTSEACMVKQDSDVQE